MKKNDFAWKDHDFHDKKLEFEYGEQLNGLFDVIIGNDVAKNLHYGLDDSIIIIPPRIINPLP